MNEDTTQTIKNRIQGSWVDINAEEVRNTNYFAPFKVPFGVNFQNDRVDFFKQFTKYEQDTLTNKKHFNAFAGFISYQLKADSLFIINPLHKNLEFTYTIDASLKDTLLLKKNDTLLYTLERFSQLKKDTLSFDQLVFSRSNCFGSCPIMNISVDKNGAVLFYGEQFTAVIGQYKAKLSPEFTTYLFKKFEAIQISKIEANYSVKHTDDQTISTTFLENGKIVKTIRDYGKAGTKEMLWAYQTIENLYTQIKLSSLTIDETKPKFNQYSFEKEGTQLLLEKSESFILWNAFQNALITTNRFKNLYIFDTSYYRNEYIKVESDGQFYKFYFKNGTITTYDIGYNFITKNFKDSDFKKIIQYKYHSPDSTADK
ncbi:DUF6438 domain-containing protein [Kordia sp.]|uniref:DUF6438 domain-containing protein n=1 Tax=Kordia sp. TaxID=1965332 RepID=UPI003D2BA173